MIVETRAAPANALVLLMDTTAGEVPESMLGRLFAATDSCLAMATLSAADGQTFLSLSDERPSGLPARLRDFECVLATPGGLVTATGCDAASNEVVTRLRNGSTLACTREVAS